MHASFAVESQRLIDAGHANEAIALCAGGVVAFPEYLGGYIILARAYMSLGKHRDAALIMEEARRLGYSGSTSSVIQTIPTAAAEAAPPAIERMEERPPEDQAAALPDSPVSTPDAIESAIIELAEVDIPVEVVHTPQVEWQAEAQTTEAQVHVLVQVPAPEPMAEPAPLHDGVPFLHVIDTTQFRGTDTRIIRAASVRLIPGLEFTSLRFEGMKGRGRREIRTLGDPPPFRTFHPKRKPMPVPQPVAASPAPGASQGTAPRKRLSLEELASRLEKARIPRQNDNELRIANVPAAIPLPRPEPSPAVAQPAGQSVITETIARIYAQQGAFEKAIEAYGILAARMPERASEYQQIIANLRTRLNS